MMPSLSALGLPRDPTCRDFDKKTPRCAFVERCFSLPMEGVRHDVGEAPPRQRARLCRAFLHDVCSLLASDLLIVGVGGGVDPVDAPGIVGGVINTNCRPVPIAGNRHGRRARAPVLVTRNHPDILNRTTLENPSEVNLALPL